MSCSATPRSSVSPLLRPASRLAPWWSSTTTSTTKRRQTRCGTRCTISACNPSARRCLHLPRSATPRASGQVHAFYICTSLTLLLSLYVVSTSTFAVAAGYRLALKGGQKGSLDRAVAVLLIEFRRVFAASAMAMWLMMAASICLIWIKVKDNGFVAISTAMYVIAFVITGLAMYRLKIRLAIAEGEHVRGDVQVGGVNLADLRLTPPEVSKAELADAPAGASTMQL